MLMLARIVPVLAGLLVVTGLCLPGAAVAGEGCPNEQLRAENNSLGLPDCRAYEMVTPAEKNSAVVGPVREPTVAADGSSLAGKSREGFAGISNDELTSLGSAFYRFSRIGSGWVPTPLQPYRGELLNIGVGDSVWGPADSFSVARLRLRAADGSLSEIGPVWPPSLGQNQELFPFSVLGVAAEAGNGVVFTIRESGFLWPFDSTISGPPLYEYTGTGNTAPSLVGVSGGAGSTALVSQCGTVLGAGDFDGEAAPGRNAVSEAGGTVFFTAKGADSNDCGGTQPPVNELFARVDGSSTVAISEPSKADCPSCDTGIPADAVFQGASADGSKVFFTTTQPLLGADTSENLYEYDLDAPAGQPKVVRVSGGDGSVSGPTAEVQGVSNISEDGSHVYFVAKGVLINVANSAGEHALPGGENLYVWERDADYPSGRIVFIAGCGAGGGQVTPDGRFLVFTSGCHLTAGDTSTPAQVFQYDAQTGSMTRVSIGLEGYNNNGNVTGAGSSALGASLVEQRFAGGERGGALARSMSDDGSYVFFQSPVALTPQALTGPEGAQKVYEYHDGRISLISSEAGLIGTSASGGDVFFTTGEALVPQDADTQVAFYDARIDGGFPVPMVVAGCSGDTCQGSPSTPPVFDSPSSVAFSGGGNLTPTVSEPMAQPKALTAAQKLSRALRACLKDPKRGRGSCEAQAKRRYGHTSRALKSDRRGN
jgi:hypothetical protein